MKRYILRSILILILSISLIALTLGAADGHRLSQNQQTITSNSPKPISHPESLPSHSALPQAIAESTPPLAPTPLPLSTEMLARNPDYIGWLTIPGLDTSTQYNPGINFPVVQTDNDNYYLDHSFDNQPDPYGAIFASTYSTERHTVIFGHQILIFDEILGYAGPEFVADYPVVLFTDLYEQHAYQIIAVYYFVSLTDVDGDGIVENYYDECYGLDDPQAFLEHLKTYGRTLYLDPDPSVDDTSRFISLQTCIESVNGEWHNNARLIVMAKELQP